MLVLTRKVGSKIIIDDHIKIQVVQIKGRQVRLGITAPKETRVHREEVQQRFATAKDSLNQADNLSKDVVQRHKLSKENLSQVDNLSL